MLLWIALVLALSASLLLVSTGGEASGTLVMALVDGVLDEAGVGLLKSLGKLTPVDVSIGKAVTIL